MVYFVTWQLNAYGHVWEQSTRGLLGFAPAILENARGPLAGHGSQTLKNRSVNNQDMSDFRNFRNYRPPSFFDRSTLDTSGAVISDKKSSLQRIVMYSVISVSTSGLMPPYRKLTVIDFPVSDCWNPPKKHFRLVGNHMGKPLPVCCHSGGFHLESTSNSFTVGIRRPIHQRISIVALTWSDVTLLGWLMLVQWFSTVW